MTYEELNELENKLHCDDIFKLIFLSELKACFRDDLNEGNITLEDIYRFTGALKEYYLDQDEHLDPFHIANCFYEVYKEEGSLDTDYLIEEAMSRYYW